MYGTDLSLFQFDNDLTLAAFMMNADKTIYGRYGTKTSKDPLKLISIEGFKRALEGALELHRKYPANRSALKGKTGPKPRWRTPETIPTLAGKHKKNDVSRWGCVHCHMAHEAVVLTNWKSGKPIADGLLWKYPDPMVLGLTLDAKERASVTAVASGSPADKARFRVGDLIEYLDGQPMLSIADVQWVLNNATETGSLKAKVKRGGATRTLTLRLSKGWRRKGAFVWRGHNISSWMIQLAIPGFGFFDLDAPKRIQMGLKGDAIAIEVAHIAAGKDDSKAARKAGLRKGDVIVGVDGMTSGMKVSDLLAYLLQKKRPGQSVALTVRRGANTLQIRLTLP